MHGRTTKIIAMNEQGLTLEEISKALGCTKSNISQTLKRHREWNRTVAPIPKEHHEWIVKSARQRRMLPQMFVAKMLMDAINKELKNGE